MYDFQMMENNLFPQDKVAPSIVMRFCPPPPPFFLTVVETFFKQVIEMTAASSFLPGI